MKFGYEAIAFSCLFQIKGELKSSPRLTCYSGIMASTKERLSHQVPEICSTPAFFLVGLRETCYTRISSYAKTYSKTLEEAEEYILSSWDTFADFQSSGTIFMDFKVK